MVAFCTSFAFQERGETGGGKRDDRKIKTCNMWRNILLGSRWYHSTHIIVHILGESVIWPEIVTTK